MVIPGHNLGNSQVSVNRTIGPTLVFAFTKSRFSHDVADLPFESWHMKTCLSYANNKGADQHVYSSSLISTCIVHCLDNGASLDEPLHEKTNVLVFDLV